MSAAKSGLEQEQKRVKELEGDVADRDVRALSLSNQFPHTTTPHSFALSRLSDRRKSQSSRKTRNCSKINLNKFVLRAMDSVVWC